MLKFCLFGFSALQLVLPAREFYADTLIQYDSGSGFVGNFTNALAALQEPSRSTPGQFGGPIDPFNPPFLPSQIVSVGSNGTLTVQFANPIPNDPANRFGIDFLIFGNPGFIITNGDFSGNGITDGSLFGHNSGITRVSVSSDNVSYFPLDLRLAPAVDSYFPTDGLGAFDRAVDPALTASSFAGLNLSGIRALYVGSGGGTGFDINWAVDANNNPAALSAVSFIRVDVLAGHAEIDGFAAVPEPSATQMVLLVLLGAFVLKRRALNDPFRFSRMTGLFSACSAGVLACKLRHSPGASIDRPTVPPASPAARRRRNSQPGRPRYGLWLLGPLSFFGSLIHGNALALDSSKIEPVAQAISEDFSTNPLTNGWQIAGDPELFSWIPGSGALAVTWDSSRQNSYFYHPLQSRVTEQNSFELTFDLKIDQIAAGVYPDRGVTFELALGLLNLEDATAGGFRRGTGRDSPNLVEFNYFPGVENVAPTFAFTMVSSNNQFLFSHNFPLTLDPGPIFHFAISYSQSAQTLRAQVTRNNQPFAPIESIQVPEGFAGFSLDALSINSYSHEGADGSIFAHGAIDNITFRSFSSSFTITGELSAAGFYATFAGQAGWTYHLERTVDFSTWIMVLGPLRGTDREMAMTDPGAPSQGLAFYRVRRTKQ